MALPLDGMIFTAPYPDQVEHGLEPEPSLHPSRKTVGRPSFVPAPALETSRVSLIAEARMLPGRSRRRGDSRLNGPLTTAGINHAWLCVSVACLKSPIL